MIDNLMLSRAKAVCPDKLKAFISKLARASGRNEEAIKLDDGDELDSILFGVFKEHFQRDSFRANLRDFLRQFGYDFEMVSVTDETAINAVLEHAQDIRLKLKAGQNGSR